MDVLLPDVAAWRAYLDQHEREQTGVWLVLTKKGASGPTSITYDQALEEALCSGWIDGQRRSRDELTFKQRFSPRRRRSLWSQRNVGLVSSLIEAGRMRPCGQEEVDRAKEDGRWDRAYCGAASAVVPDNLQAALDASPEAQSAFNTLNASDRYTILHRVMTGSAATSRARIAKIIETLEGSTTPKAGSSTEKTLKAKRKARAASGAPV